MGKNITVSRKILHPQYGEALTVRQATGSDAPVVQSIASAVALADRGGEASEKGFLIYVRDRVAYRRNITGSSVSFIAHVRGTPAGFLLAYRSSETDGSGKSADPVIRYIRKTYGGDFVYLDQLAVVRIYCGGGVGQQLLDALTEKADGKKIFAAVAMKPVRNAVSVYFFGTKNGWLPSDTVNVGDVAGRLYIRL